MIRGLGMHLGNLSRLSNVKTRSISVENPTVEKSKGAMSELYNPGTLGCDWKCRPAVVIKASETFTIADIGGAGVVQLKMRLVILRIYWDGQEQPSVECPIDDFFCGGWGCERCKCDDGFAQVLSLPVCVNLVPKGEVFTILDGVKGQGQHVGSHMLCSVNAVGWWGEGEIKFYMDGDLHSGYREFTAPYTGMYQVIRPYGLYHSQQRLALYRWQLPTPSDLDPTCASSFQAWGFGASSTKATSIVRTIWPRWPTGIKRCPLRPSRPSQPMTNWKSSNLIRTRRMGVYCPRENKDGDAPCNWN